MNYKFRHTALLAALPLLLAACQTDDEPMPQTGRQANTLRFNVDAAIALTKSLPEKPQTEAGAVQHVNAARLYIFKHGEGDQTTLASIENPDWSTLAVIDGENKKTVTKEYTLTTKLDPTTTYTFLGVGYEDFEQGENDYQGDTYQETDDKGTTLVEQSPVTLSTLVTTLKDGRGKEDIRHNEYFTGALTLTTDNKGYIKSGSTVEMRRRVAGLSAYLKLENFPENEAIGGVAIMLWEEQNQSVPTLEKTWQLPDFTDFTDKPLETPDADPQAQSVCLLWMTGPETDTQAYNEATSDYTCQGSAYVLPKPAPEAGSTDYTLAVVVYNAENKVICTKRAALAEEGYLIFDTSLGTGIIDDGSFYRYPIVANRFYRFGKDNDPLDVVYDPQNPFEIVIETEWEGKPDMGVDDYTGNP